MVNKVTPNDGGCWFCHTIEPFPEMFTTEWDANLHLDCLKRHLPLNEDSYDPEAIVILREFSEMPELAEYKFLLQKFKGR